MEGLFFRIIAQNEGDVLINKISAEKMQMLTVLEKIEENESQVVYKNLNANRIVYVAEEVIAMDEFGESLEYDGLVGIGKKSYVVGDTLQNECADAEISNIKIECNKVSFNVAAEGMTFINHSQLYYPGWNVYVDGTKKPLYLVNNLIQGTYVDLGEHFVEFRYEPLEIYVGGIISLLGVLITLILGYKFGKKSMEETS